MAVAGVALLFLNGNLTLGIGDLLSLFCCRWICISDFPDRRICKKNIRQPVLNLVQMFTAFVLSTISMFVFGETDFQVTTKGWLSVLYLAVISTTICYLLQTACQKYVEETKAAIILCMESVFGTVFSIIILHEVITPRMVAGCIIILIAVIISNLSESGGEGNRGKLAKGRRNRIVNVKQTMR